MAIIGSGIGGICTAFFCDHDWDIEIFEALDKIGGHCDSLTVDLGGVQTNIDLGAQFFHPKSHPLYTSILEDLDLFHPTSEHFATTRMGTDLSVFDGITSQLMMDSKKPWKALHRIPALLLYMYHAKKFVAEQRPWDLTVEQWLDELPVTESDRLRMILPILSAFLGTTYEDTRRVSARATLLTFAPSLPDNLWHRGVIYNAKLGLAGNMREILGRTRASVHTRAAVMSVEHVGSKWYLQCEKLSRQGPYDVVVINAPPLHSKKIFASVGWADSLVSTLNEFEYFESELALHTDPMYMHRDRSHWCDFNVETSRDAAELSVWVKTPQQTKKQSLLFKSWITSRTREPQHILARRRFSHQLNVAATHRAVRKLNHYEGLNGLWFVGSSVMGTDLHDAAAHSAMRVAERLSPNSPTLAQAKRKLAHLGIKTLPYEVF